MSPPVCASGAAARPSGRARLSALHRGSCRGFNLSAQLQARFPGTRSARGLPALSCPSPVAAPHAPVVMPADMMPEAARVRTVSFRPRAPLSLRNQEHPHDGVRVERDVPNVSKPGRVKKGLRISVDFAGLNHVPPIRDAVRRGVFFWKKIRTRIANIGRPVKPGGDDVKVVARMERSVIRDCREASMPPRNSLRSSRVERA
jgi:hypothetical protein